ncbi:MAG: DUF1549 and DUF1553 domain-containing protein [Isosphaeraceae bacterium]
MRFARPRAAWLVVLCLAHGAKAAELRLLPASARLDGPHARQRFLVEEESGGRWVGDVSGQSKFSTDDPRVATVSEDGTVTPVGNGQTTLRARVGGRTANATLSVENQERPDAWSFRNHVEPVLTRAGCNSGACHGAAAGKNGFRLTLRAYGPEVDHAALTRQALGRRVMPTAPSESLLLLKPTGAIEHGGGVRFSPESLEYRVVSEWIADGCPAPSAGDPRVARLEVEPPAALLAPGSHQQVIVRAFYNDGRVEDVTRWAKFASSDDTVAKVDEDGRVKVEGHGEAAVSVWFSSLVATSVLTSPNPTKVDPKVYRDAPRRNPIDDKNLAKLESLNIPPSPDAGDATFARRSYLDATGTLPPVGELERFLSDPSPDRRARLVDRLLQSPEYVDYWAYKWSDLLLVSSNRLPAPAMWAFYRFVRGNVERNEPWDRFARAVVTAKGSTLANGAANYYVLHRDPIDLTESSSMAFLGLSLTCARCHNHPMEKWTQDQYYGMASLFSRVQLKDGPAAGDVVVMPAAEGEIRHPRTGAVMAPQPLDAAAGDTQARGDRREAFADWLARPENPYFDRAVVNRVWHNFFGRGLIDPVDDLRATNPPSDGPLLDWLVNDFRAYGRDVKHLIRTIMTSAVYARSSAPVPGNAGDSKFLSHYPVKRLPAEVLLDAIARVTEVPSSFSGYPAGWRSLQLPDSKVESAFLSSFGRPERLNTCSCERSAEPSMSQALHLANGTTVNDKLRSPESAVAKAMAAKASDAEVLDRLFLAALSRRPTDSERARVLGALAEATKGVADEKARVEARRQAVEDLYWAVLTGNEFLFNH